MLYLIALIYSLPLVVITLYLYQEPELGSMGTGCGKVEGELGDGPDVKGKIPPNVVPAKIPEGGIFVY